MLEAGHIHGAEFRRCLIALDVPGLLKLWAHVAPHLARLSPARALIAAHMARVEMKYISKQLKAYSIAFLAERGVRKIDGRWVEGLPKPEVIAEVVGISVNSRDPRVARRIHTAMEDALLNSMAKGVTEAPMQREAMMRARAKTRFKLRMA